MKINYLITLFFVLFSTSCIEKNRLDLNKIPQSEAISVIKPKSFRAGEKLNQSYVPVYSDLLLSHEESHIALQGFVSIRNTDFTNPIFIQKINYYDTNGKFIRKHINEPIYIKPFSSYNIVIKTSDLDGGSGAKFIIDYKLAEGNSKHPLIEALFTGTFGTKAISFSSRAVLLTN